MPFSITWQPELYTVVLEFETLAKNIKSLKEPLDRMVRQVFIPAIKNQWAVGGDPPWKPLAEFTVDKKGHDEILVETGDLMKQAQYLKNWTINGPAGTAALDSLNENVSYGYLHQTGFVNWVTGRMTAPRVWASFNEGDEEKAVQVIQDWFDERTSADVGMTSG